MSPKTTMHRFEDCEANAVSHIILDNLTRANIYDQEYKTPADYAYLGLY